MLTAEIEELRRLSVEGTLLQYQVATGEKIAGWYPLTKTEISTMVCVDKKDLRELLDAAEENDDLRHRVQIIANAHAEARNDAMEYDRECTQYQQQLQVLADENAELNAHLGYMREEIVPSQEWEKRLLAAIREADAKREAWIEQPTWVCEEYDDFNVAWEAVMKLVEGSGK